MPAPRLVGTLCAAVALLCGVAAAPAQAAGTATSFTVDTQFVDGPSAIIDASGPLAACTEVTDLSGFADQRTHNQLVFSGEKELTCDGGTVTIGYEAFITLPALQTGRVPAGGGFKTFGTWWVVTSTLDGVSSGGGKLTGDSRGCELVPGSEGCITDAFRGFVS